MKQRMPFLGLLSFALLISSVACKKDDHQDVEKNDSEITAHADDETFFTAETDAVFYDANLLLEASAVSPRHQDNPICDATVAVDPLSNPQTITVTYNGTGCLGDRTRKGVIVLSAPQGTQWKNAGASVTIAFRDFKITRNSDNKSVTINGEQTYTNTSGGLLAKLATLESVTHTVSADGLSVTFDNGSKRSWQVAQQRLFTYDNGIVLAVSGTHTDNNDSHIAIWGTNRFGAAFATSTIEPLIIRQDCSFRLTGGVVKHTVGSTEVTATFGLDAAGNPVSCPAGNYYYKLVWTGPNGNTVTAVLAY